MINNNKVFEVADIPIYEVVSGWNAYKGDDTVEFHQQYSFHLKKDNCLYIKTTGTVNFDKKYKVIPSSEFVYDDLTHCFKQIRGKVIQDGLLSNTYSNLAEIKGNWFTLPKEVKLHYSQYDEW